jgi:hypothetical protein
MVKKLNESSLGYSNPIHTPFVPENIREGDEVEASVKVDNKWVKVRVWKYSPFGIEFIVTDKSLGSLGRGSDLDLEVKLGREKSLYTALVVNEMYQEHGQVLAGVRTFRPDHVIQTSEDRREHKRWTVSPDFIPTGMAPSPLRFNDFIHFKLDNVSAGGVRIITSMRNKMIGKDQRLAASISLPLIGSVQANLVIRHLDTIELDGKEHLLLGTEIVGADSLLMASLAEYLLNFADGITISSLKEDGFPIKAAKWLDFSYVKTEEEYREVLELRYNSYRLANKLEENKTSADMADEYDARARILIVKHRGKIVGSLRAMFHENDDATEHEQYIKYPQGFPRVSDFVEATRVCTDTSIRGSDVLYVLLSHLLLTAVKSGRRYIVGCAAGSLIDFYKKCGYFPVKNIPPFKSKALANIEHQLIMMDTHEIALGRNISMRSWNSLYADVVDYMIQQEIIRPTTSDKIRINFRKTMSNIFLKKN